MKPISRKLFVLYLSAVGVFSLAAVIFRTLLLLNSYSAEDGLFAAGYAADFFFPLLFVLAAVFFAGVGFVFLRGGEKAKEPISTVPVFFSSILCAFCALIFAVAFLISLPGDGTWGTMALMQKLSGVLLPLSALGMALSFALTVLRSSNRALTVAGSIFSVLFCIFYCLYSYFDKSLPLNSPTKIFDLLTVLILMLFFLTEGKFRLGGAPYARYAVTGAVAAIFCAADSLPALIYTAVKGEALRGNAVYDFLFFALFLYLLARAAALGENEQAEVTVKRSAAFSASPSRTRAPSRDDRQQTFDFDAPKEPAPREPVNERASSEFDTTAHTTMEFKNQ